MLDWLVKVAREAGCYQRHIMDSLTAGMQQLFRLIFCIPRRRTQKRFHLNIRTGSAKEVLSNLLLFNTLSEKRQAILRRDTYSPILGRPCHTLDGWNSLCIPYLL